MTTVRQVVTRFAPQLALWTLIAIACLTVAATYSVFGHTWDEPEHLAAGVALLDTGTYPYDAQHPPLARIAMALGPYLAGAHSHGNVGPSGEQEGRDILYGEGQYQRYLTLARIGMLPFLVLLLIATWLWGRYFYGNVAAVLATAFVVTTPTLLGHAGVAALDVPMMATTLFALYWLARWFDAPSWKLAVIFGAAAGVAVGTKLSAIPFIGCVALAWTVVWIWSAWLIRKTNASQPANASAFYSIYLWHAALAAGVACVALIFCYGFGFTKLSPTSSLSVPFGIPAFIDSLRALAEHNADGHLSFFMGETRRRGWWDFYIVALSVKTPLPLLILGICGLAWLLFRAWSERKWLVAAPTLAFAAILLFSSDYSHINIGVRHVMVLFPLLALGAATLGLHLWQRSTHIAPRIALLVLLCWQASSLPRAHPDHLAYFNELAGAHPEHILVDSDLDWGQDLRRLSHTLRERNIQSVSVVYRGTADLSRERLPQFKRLAPHQRTTGWIAVFLLAKETGDDGRGYTWLDDYTPVMRIGKSIDLYYIAP